jgi:hypothetical protein
LNGLRSESFIAHANKTQARRNSSINRKQGRSLGTPLYSSGKTPKPTTPVPADAEDAREVIEGPSPDTMVIPAADEPGVVNTPPPPPEAGEADKPVPGRVALKAAIQESASDMVARKKMQARKREERTQKRKEKKRKVC